MDSIFIRLNKSKRKRKVKVNEEKYSGGRSDQTTRNQTEQREQWEQRHASKVTIGTHSQAHDSKCNPTLI